MSDGPPSYDQAIGGELRAAHAGDTKSAPGSQQSRNGLTPAVRRSMEDEQRPLPDGWIRQFDTNSKHQFFVDTNSKPARPIWHHPYDDEDYLRTLSPAERARVASVHNPHTHDPGADSTDEEDTHHQGAPPYGNGLQSSKSETLGQKMKDKLTGSTHEERQRQRDQRAQEEQRALQRHQAIRHAMVQAEQTGQPQLIGKDKDGHDVYIEPPGGAGGQGGGQASYNNPYVSSRAHSDPNARFIRPDYAYQRPYGHGYGGGLGYPLAGGLMGGLLLGDMMGGYGGMGMMGGMGGMGGMGA